MTTDNVLDSAADGFSQRTMRRFRLTTVLGAAAAALIAVAGLIGYFPELHFLGRIRPNYIPMAPSTAIFFLVLCFAQLGQARKLWQGTGRAVLTGMILLVTTLCSLHFVGSCLGADLVFEKKLFPDAGELGGVPIGHMSPATGAVFVLAGLGTLILLRRRPGTRCAGRLDLCASMLGILTVLAGSTVLLGYLYGTPLMYGSGTVPMAATTAMAFQFLGVALVAGVGPGTYPMRLLVGESTAARLSRALLPLTMAVMVLQCLLSRVAADSTALDDALLLAALLIVSWTIMAGLVARVAHSIGRSIDALNTQLRRGEEQHRVILETAMNGFWQTDAVGRLLEVNEAYCRMSGYTAQELLTKRISDLEADERSEETALRIERIRAQGEERFETRHRRKDGGLFDVEVNVQYRPVDDGRFVVFLQDVTERKRAEQVLHDREEVLRVMTGATHSAFLMMDERGRISFYNPAAEGIFGWTAEEAMGRDLHELLVPVRYRSDYAAYIEQFRLAGEGPAVGGTIELTALRRDGSEFPVEVSLSSVELHGMWHAVGVVRDISERKKSEEELRFRNVLLSTQQETSLDGILVVDEAGTLLSFNQRFVEMWNLSPEVIASRSDETALKSVLVNLEDAEQFLESVRRIYENREASSHDEVCLRGGRIFDRYSSPMCGDKGRYYGRVFYFRDVTEQKSMLNTLQQSEERYRTLFRSSQDAIMTLEPPSWRYTAGNPACVAMFGAANEREFTSCGPWELSPERQPGGQCSSALAAERIESAMREGRLFFEWRHRRLSGEEFPATVLLTRVEIGDHAFLQATVRDITEQKQMEETLRASEEKFRQIVDSMGLGVTLVGTDLRIIEMNRQMRKWFPGVDLNHSPTCHASFNDPPAAERCRTCPAVETFQDGQMHEGTIVLWRTGGARTMKVISSPIHDQSGHVVAAIETIEDVTEKLRMESELAQAQKLESVGRLAAGIAHEINTPTQYVGDNLEFLQMACGNLANLAKVVPAVLAATGDSALPPGLLSEARRLLEMANLHYVTEQVPRALEQSIEGVGRIATIVQAMKEFSHPGMAEKTPVDLNQCILSTATVSRNEWKYVADLVLDLEDGLPQVSCFPGDFNQAILNMIVNAAHAIADVVGEGGEKGTITVSTQQRDAWVEVRIADTGPGIAEEIRGQIFDPFFTTKEVGRGTGQGLAIARHVIVEKHGGSLVVESVAGKGAVFVVRLPLGDSGKDIVSGTTGRMAR